MSLAFNITQVVFLVALSGLFSGLTLGLMSLDLTGLEVVMAGGTEANKRYAKKIATVRVNGNLLLCTLLLGNVAVNAALSIVLASLSGGLVGFLVSTVLIVLFGEIIPQAVCSRHALKIGAHTVWLVRVFQVLLAPIVYPLAMALDKLLGREVGALFSRGELKKLVEMHHNTRDIEQDEARILSGALDFGERRVSEIMTPIKNAFMLEVHRNLDFEVLSEVFKSGYSRIPIFDKDMAHDSIMGLLFVKDLILLDPEEATPIRTIVNFYGRQVPKVFPDCPLKDLLEIFKSGRSHMAIVHDVNAQGDGDPYYYNVGLVTLEDIIETIIQDEIIDETDRIVDLRTGELVEKRGQPRVFDGRLSRRVMPKAELTPQESSAIFHHFTGTVDFFKPQQRLLSAAMVKRLISYSSIVTEVKMHPGPGELGVNPDDPNEDDEAALARRSLTDVSEGGLRLYSRGEPSSFMTLILDGSAEVLAGREGFVSHVGRWALLCVDALAVAVPEAVRHDVNEFARLRDTFEQELLADLPPFVPDFTAIVSEDSRVLRISREDYVRAVFKQSVAEFQDREYAENRGLRRMESFHQGAVPRGNSNSGNNAIELARVDVEAPPQASSSRRDSRRIGGSGADAASPDQVAVDVDVEPPTID